MSSNLTNESGDQVLAGRSLVVVLREKTTDDDQRQRQVCVESTQRDNSAAVTLHLPQQQQSQRTGWDIFTDFVSENKNCYWNPHLEESIRNLQYIGYLHPTTLLVGGRDIYIDTVRGAWTRRVLRPPRGFHIVRVGDLESLETQPVPQTQFTPLPEALCMTIADLNRSHNPATFDVIQCSLAHTYRRVHPPSEEIIYETLGSLIREHKIVYSGGSYFAMTPDLHMVHTNCIVVHDNHLVLAGDCSTPAGAFPQFPTLFIPLGVATEKRSISCQTDGHENEKSDIYGQKLDSSMSSQNTTDDDPVSQRKSFGRSRSVRESRKKKDKADSLTRSESLRYSSERSRQLVKDINLKSSIVHQNKGKGEKTSLLSKLFGRGSNKKRSQSVGDRNTGPRHKVEYATFSAQFPPPDLAFQIQRMQLQHHSAATLQHCDVATQSEVNEVDEDYGYSQLSPVCRTDVMERSRSLASNHSRSRGSGQCGDVMNPRLTSKATKRDRSVTKSHGKRNTESNVKSKKHDRKEVVSHGKQNTDPDVFTRCRRRDARQDGGEDIEVSAFAMSVQCDLSDAIAHKRNARSDAKSTQKDVIVSHQQIDSHPKHTSRFCKQGLDPEQWNNDAKHMSRSCHQDVIVASPCGERNLQRPARQDHCVTSANERRTKSCVQNNHIATTCHVADGNEGHKVNLGKKQQRRRSRKMAQDEEYCRDCHDTNARHNVNDAVTQRNSPAMLLNNGCPEAEHMAEHDGHRMRVFQKYREYCGSTLDNGGDMSVAYCGYLPQKSHGTSRDSGVNVVGLATPHNHKYPTRPLGDAVCDMTECLQDSGFNSPRGLQLTPARSIPPGDGVTFVQNLRHLPDLPTDYQPCPAGGTASPRWHSTDVGDARGCSWSSSSRQTVLPAWDDSARSHPKPSLISSRHKQIVTTSPRSVTVATECANNWTDTNTKVRIRPRDRSPKKHVIGIHDDRCHKSRATADSVSKHPAVSQKQAQGIYVDPEGAVEPHFREGLLLADGSSGQYMSYKDLGDCKIVAVV